MKDLLSTFSVPSNEEWLNQIKADLKTEDPFSLLNRHADGLDMQAAYQEIEQTAFHNTQNREPVNPEFAYANEWLSMVSANTDDLVKTNKRLVKLLEHGAGSVLMTGFGISNQEELRLAMKGILPEVAPISFSAGEATPALLFMLIDEFERMQCDSSKIKGCLGWDPLTDFIRNGAFSNDIGEVFNLGKALLQRGASELPEYHIIKIKGSVFHHAGGNAIQELAAICSAIADTVVKLEPIEPALILKHLRVNMSAGSDVLVQVAKFRAMRVLWGMLCKGFGLNEELFFHLETETAFRNKSSLDPYNNLLRCTLETFSAVSGGCNEHLVHPYNAHFEEDNFDAALLGLNIQHLLREESRLDKVLDPLAGAPYIETMTRKLVEQAWELFLRWEDKGGFIASARAGLIQEEIIAQRAKTEKEIRTRKRVIVGVNKYADPNPVNIQKPLAEKDPLLGLPQIKPLEPYFETLSFESVRKLLCLDKQPAACIFEDGDAKMSRLRSGFSSDFLASGGIKCLETERSVPLKDRFFSNAAQTADIWVFCSDDNNYREMISAFQAESVKGKTLLIAGNPKNVDISAETEELIYIYSGCDAIHALHAILETTEQNIK